MINLPLKEKPYDNWEDEYNRIISDPFIQRKYNRDRRLNDKLSYISEWTPEVMHGGGFVIDIGPGPGEYLELCRFFGNKIKGFDAKPDLSMMGDNYVKLSILMAKRQKISIIFDNFINIIENDNTIQEDTVSLINSQGAIEQIFKNHIEFPEGINKEGWIPSHNGCWVLSEECQEDFNNMFLRFNKWLRPKSKIVIYPNGSKNNEVFDNIIRNSIVNIKTLELLDKTDPTGRIKIITKI